MAIGKVVSRGNGHQTTLQNRAMYLSGPANSLAEKILLEDSLKKLEERKSKPEDDHSTKRPKSAYFNSDQVLYLRWLREFGGWSKRKVATHYANKFGIPIEVIYRILDYTNYTMLVPKKDKKYDHAGLDS